MDYGIFNVCADVNACDCMRGCMDTVRESALKVDSGRKNPFPHRGIKPTLVMCRSDAVPAEPHLHSAIVIITACWLVTEGLQFAVLIPQNTS